MSTFQSYSTSIVGIAYTKWIPSLRAVYCTPCNSLIGKSPILNDSDISGYVNGLIYHYRVGKKHHASVTGLKEKEIQNQLIELLLQARSYGLPLVDFQPRSIALQPIHGISTESGFYCPWDGCNYATTSFEMLQKHWRKEHNESSSKLSKEQCKCSVQCGFDCTIRVIDPSDSSTVTLADGESMDQSQSSSQFTSQLQVDQHQHQQQSSDGDDNPTSMDSCDDSMQSDHVFNMFNMLMMIIQSKVWIPIMMMEEILLFHFNKYNNNNNQFKVNNNNNNR
jgi:hypothetical protein